MAKKKKKSKKKDTKQKFGIIFIMILILASVLSFYSWSVYVQKQDSLEYEETSIEFRNEIVTEVAKLSENIQTANNKEVSEEILSSISLLSKEFAFFTNSSSESFSPDFIESNKNFLGIVSQIEIDAEALSVKNSNVGITELIVDFNNQTNLLIEEQKVISEL